MLAMNRLIFLNFYPILISNNYRQFHISRLEQWLCAVGKTKVEAFNGEGPIIMSNNEKAFQCNRQAKRSKWKADMTA